jgi:hypothetical protein
MASHMKLEDRLTFRFKFGSSPGSTLSLLNPYTAMISRSKVDFVWDRSSETTKKKERSERIYSQQDDSI